MNNLSVFSVQARTNQWQLAGNGQVYEKICLKNINCLVVLNLISLSLGIQ